MAQCVAYFFSRPRALDTFLPRRIRLAQACAIVDTMTSEQPPIRVVSAAVVEDGRYLITQRGEKAVLPLLWEFPGGRVEPGESDAQALTREMQHRVGAPVAVHERISETTRVYRTYTVHLSLYRCTLLPEQNPPTAMRVRDLRWVASQDFDDFAFTPADEAGMNALLFGKMQAR